MQKTVLCAMSGGVDSSVAAYLLKEQGYKVMGITMKTWARQGGSTERSCCGIDDVDDARRVAAKLDIPYIALDMETVFKETVIHNFTSEYLNGRTPNPCIVCNYKLKFGYLLDKADELGADLVATGHYARLEKEGDRYCIKKGEDQSKDQSYVLYNLTQEQLSRTLLPLSEYPKEEIRKIALEQGFTRVANKPDSVEICFVKDNYRDFLKENVGHLLHKARFVNTRGEDLGESEGIAMYTIGQRKGLGINLGEKAFVVKINAAKNQVVLGSREDLFQEKMEVERVNWVSIDNPIEEFKARVQIRYQHEAANARVIPGEDGNCTVMFEDAQEAIAPGQSAVFYRGEEVLGGGIIRS